MGYVVGGCNVVATEHGRYGLSCMQKLWSARAVLGLYGMLGVELCCEILLLDMAHRVVFYVEGCRMSSAEYHVHLVGVSRLYACREFCGVHN